VRLFGRVLRGVARLVGAHGLFAAVLAVAITVRVVTMAGYPSVLWFGDSVSYLTGALHVEPSPRRPSGYSLFLWALKSFHSFTVVAAVQHGLGVVSGVMVYALVWRAARRAWPRWILLPGLPAAAAAVPVLFDAYQLELEHLLMSDELFTFLMVAAVTVVMWRRRLSWWAGGLAGLILAAAALTRSVGLPLLLVVLVCMVVRRSGWRAVCAMVVVFAIPVVAYMSWFQSVNGQFTMTRTTNIFLYGRTADFADCTVIKPRPELVFLCPKSSPSNPEVMARAYANMWTKDSPLRHIPGGIGGVEANKLTGEFAKAAIKAQPRDYWDVVWRDTMRSFGAERLPYPTPWTAHEYEFPVLAALSDAQMAVAYPYGGKTAWPAVVEPQASWVRAYQDRFFVPGPVLGYLLIAGIAGMLVRVRRWGGSPVLPWCISVAMLVIPAATADFDYRYVVPALPFACLAAGLTLIAFARTGAAALGWATGRHRTRVPAGSADEAASGATEPEPVEPEPTHGEPAEEPAKEPDEEPAKEPVEEPDAEPAESAPVR
jgi:hypothetical protein